jgi:diguanylate cyclase (GGDEF)-like protein
MKAAAKLTILHLACTAAAFSLAERFLPSGGILRDAVILAASGLFLFRLVSHELARRDRTEAILRVQATHDSLTGLVNRAYFEETLQRASARATRDGHPFGVVYIDLDDFKQVNDRYGHHVGDLLLQEVADRIGSVVRASDCAARFGGDEFVILVDDHQECGVHRLAERLHEAFAAPFLTESYALAMSASIGVAFHPLQGRQGLSLLQSADKAMYAAKRSRRTQSAQALSPAA